MLKYEKEKLIGNGSYGDVWLIRRRGTKDVHVLKEVNLNSLSSTERNQAMMEAEILSKCSHTNIIKYISASIDPDRKMLEIVMEYADGGDLHTAIIKQRGIPFTQHTVISWFIQICLALQYIHYRNIIHRDLKTQNIFLTRERCIKVGDFGISRVLRESEELATTAIGTPYYLSPEICMRKPYDYKTDMWALGCILFETAALVHPFQAKNFPDLLVLILKGKRKQLPKHCSPLIAKLVDSLLNVFPQNRPSADEILSMPALQSYLSEHVTSRVRVQSKKDASSRHKAFLRRLSLSNDVKETSFKESSSTKRRASSAVENPKAAKIHASFSSFVRGSIKTSFGIAKKPYKVSPLSKEVKTDQIQKTYRVLSSNLSSEANIWNLSCISSKGTATLTPYKKSEGNSSAATTQSDYGYLSEEVFETVPTKSQPMQSKRLWDNCQAEADSSVLETSLSMKQCHHSQQCQECILDMLWKNRIRSPSGSSANSSEREEFETKLKSVFGPQLFKKLYELLSAQWETKENAIQNVVESLNHRQVQNLPLLLQLIQLDILEK